MDADKAEAGRNLRAYYIFVKHSLVTAINARVSLLLPDRVKSGEKKQKEGQRLEGNQL